MTDKEKSQFDKQTELIEFLVENQKQMNEKVEGMFTEISNLVYFMHDDLRRREDQMKVELDLRNKVVKRESFIRVANYFIAAFFLIMNALYYNDLKNRAQAEFEYWLWASNQMLVELKMNEYHNLIRQGNNENEVKRLPHLQIKPNSNFPKIYNRLSEKYNTIYYDTSKLSFKKIPFTIFHDTTHR